MGYQLQLRVHQADAVIAAMVAPLDGRVYASNCLAEPLVATKVWQTCRGEYWIELSCTPKLAPPHLSC